MKGKWLNEESAENLEFDKSKFSSGRHVSPNPFSSLLSSSSWVKFLSSFKIRSERVSFLFILVLLIINEVLIKGLPFSFSLRVFGDSVSSFFSLLNLKLWYSLMYSLLWSKFWDCDEDRGVVDDGEVGEGDEGDREGEDDDELEADVDEELDEVDEEVESSFEISIRLEIFSLSSSVTSSIGLDSNCEELESESEP